MQMQLGPQMQTSTPIHSTFAQSNAPHILVNGQGQGHMNTQTTTTNQDMVFNLQTILNDIQSRLTKVNLLDRINDRLWSIEQRIDMDENDVHRWQFQNFGFYRENLYIVAHLFQDTFHVL
jgi:hypothetical protein